MRSLRGIGNRHSALVRMRFLAPIAAGLVLGVSGLALASRIETSPSHAEIYSGSDWVGKVSLLFTEIDSTSGKASFSLSLFRFANLCSRRGSELSATIRLGRDKRFHYRGHGFTVAGNLIGSIASPREIAGTASVARGGCRSGPWWFSVLPGP